MYWKRCEHISCSYSYCRYSDFAFCLDTISAIPTSFYHLIIIHSWHKKYGYLLTYYFQTHDKMHMNYRKGYMIPCIEAHCIRILSHTYCRYTHISSFKLFILFIPGSEKIMAVDIWNADHYQWNKRMMYYQSSMLSITLIYFIIIKIPCPNAYNTIIW